MFPNKDTPWGWEKEVIQERSRDVPDAVDKKDCFLLCFVQNIWYLGGTSDVTTILDDRVNILQISCKTLPPPPPQKYCCVVHLHGSEHTQCFRWFQSDAVFFHCSKFSVWVYNTSDIPTGQTINWSKIQLSWVLMLYYPYKMFSGYKSVIVTPCACSLFVNKETKITRYMNDHFWQLFFGAFSVCDHCILKSTTAWCWNYVLSIYIYI